MTTCYLAASGNWPAIKLSLQHDPEPAILVSSPYLDEWDELRKTGVKYRQWMMDSGAYSAWNSGKPIDIDWYIDMCLARMQGESKLVEIIALDKIGDGPGSLENAQRMRDRGVPAVPVFHYGEDEGLLRDYCAGWPKVGLSCRFGETTDQSFKFYDQCFARHWPHKFHSFGWMSNAVLMRYPFHSADSSSWALAPSKFGTWPSLGISQQGVNVKGIGMRSEVDAALKAERAAKLKWRGAFAQL